MEVRLFIRVIALAVLLSAALSAGEIMPTMINTPAGSFSSIGFTNVVGSYIDAYGTTHDALPDRGILQVSGNNPMDSAVSSGDVAAGLIEAFAGLNAGSLQGLLDPAPIPTFLVDTGSAVKFSNWYARPSDTFAFLMNFVSNDYFPFDDFSFFAFGAHGATADQYDIIDRISVVGDLGSTGWYKYTLPVTISSAGYYDITLGAMNAHIDPDDSSASLNSALLLEAAPEPATYAFVGSALLVAALLKRRGRAQ